MVIVDNGRPMPGAVASRHHNSGYRRTPISTSEEKKIGVPTAFRVFAKSALRGPQSHILIYRSAFAASSNHNPLWRKFGCEKKGAPGPLPLRPTFQHMWDAFLFHCKQTMQWPPPKNEKDELISARSRAAEKGQPAIYYY